MGYLLEHGVYGFSSSRRSLANVMAEQAAEKFGFRVGRGFIPGLEVYISGTKGRYFN
jgi:hypothetical protein